MTLQELEAYCDAYYASGAHIASAEWSALTASRRSALVNTALTDVLTVFPNDTLDDLEAGCKISMAVAEQALWLDSHADSGGGGGYEVSSESVDGMSVTYRSSVGGVSIAIALSRRAAALIGAELQARRGGLRILRG